MKNSPKNRYIIKMINLLGLKIFSSNSETILHSELSNKRIWLIIFQLADNLRAYKAEKRTLRQTIICQNCRSNSIEWTEAEVSNWSQRNSFSFKSQPFFFYWSSCDESYWSTNFLSSININDKMRYSWRIQSYCIESPRVSMNWKSLIMPMKRWIKVHFHRY